MVYIWDALQAHVILLVFIPNCTRKSIWLIINNIHERIAKYRNIIMYKEHARITWKTYLFKEQLRSIRKTIFPNDFITFLIRQKVQLDSSTNPLVCTRITFDEMESSPRIVVELRFDVAAASRDRKIAFMLKW